MCDLPFAMHLFEHKIEMQKVCNKELNIIDHNLFVRYVKTANSVVLDYSVDFIQLDENDFLLDYGELGNFSVAGFEMILYRHVSHYLITYYLPSGIL